MSNGLSHRVLGFLELAKSFPNVNTFWQNIGKFLQVAPEQTFGTSTRQDSRMSTNFFGLPEAGGEKVTIRKFLEHVALVRDQNFEVLLGSIKQRVIFRHFLKRLPRGSPPWRADDLRLTDRDRNDPVLRLARPSELLVL